MNPNREALYWAFTWNNYTNADPLPKDQCRYYLVGEEICPTTGTPHLQGFVIFLKKKRLSAVKRLLPEAHWEPTKSSFDKNRVYCSKDGKFIEYGDPRTEKQKYAKKKADDDNAVYRKAITSENIDDALEIIKNKRPRDYLLYGETIERNLKRNKVILGNIPYPIDKFSLGYIDFENKAVLLWGNTGTGKTCYALAQFKNPLLVRHLDQLADYNSANHDGIVFDDLSFYNRPPDSIIHLLDWELESAIHIRYRVKVIPAKTKKIFTHNTENPFYRPETTDTQIQNAILRRLKIIYIEDVLYDLNK